MKPLVYFDFEEHVDSNYVVVKKTRLKEIFDEVYQAGYEDGRQKTPTITTTP